MAENRLGVLLVNLGTPDSTSTQDVRKYLREFLSDPRVIDIPAIARWLLLNLIILPLRPRKSAHAYRTIWDAKRGSPLKYFSEDLITKLQAALPHASVKLAMRYQNPSIAKAMQEFSAQGISEICVVPMFPQYSSAAWGSAAQAVMEVASRQWNVPSLRFVKPFYQAPQFVSACAAKARNHLNRASWDHVLFSFHGLPERHCQKSAPNSSQCCRTENCCESIRAENSYCYRAQCFVTARLIADELQLAAGSWTVCFQSRLGSAPWIRPYTDKVVDQLASQGVKRVLVVSPSFVADCLETLEEIRVRLREQFIAAGGAELELVDSLNDDETWVQALVAFIE